MEAKPCPSGERRSRPSPATLSATAKRCGYTRRANGSLGVRRSSVPGDSYRMRSHWAKVKVIGPLPGEYSAATLVWAVLDRASRGWRGFTMTPAEAAPVAGSAPRGADRAAAAGQPLAPIRPGKRWSAAAEPTQAAAGFKAAASPRGVTFALRQAGRAQALTGGAGRSAAFRSPQRGRHLDLEALQRSITKMATTKYREPPRAHNA